MPKTASKKSSKDTSKKSSKRGSKKGSKKVSKKPLKVYCGIKEPMRSNHRRGSMQECLNAGKVSYYGIKKVDSRLLNKIDKENKNKLVQKEINALRGDIAGISGKENRFKRELDGAKSDTDIKKAKDKLAECKEEKIKIIEKIKRLKEKLIV